jgi:hypothetical protein
MFDKLFTIFIGAAILAICVLGYFAVKELNQFEADCNSRGGKVIESGDRYYCVKKDFFL